MLPNTPQLRVLVYQEDGEWVAHLLEMDLVGTGETPDAAETELFQAFEAQLTYCSQNNLNPLFPAPKEFFDLWDAVQQEELVSFVMTPDRKQADPHRRARVVSPDNRSSYRQDGWRAQTCPG